MASAEVPHAFCTASNLIEAWFTAPASSSRLPMLLPYMFNPPSAPPPAPQLSQFLLILTPLLLVPLPSFLPILFPHLVQPPPPGYCYTEKHVLPSDLAGKLVNDAAGQFTVQPVVLTPA